VLPELVNSAAQSHIRPMAKPKAKTRTRRSTTAPERVVVYRGIKIAPLGGKRSATSRVLREALRTSGQPHGEPAHA